MADLIGLGGWFRSGKDEVADFLVREYDFVKLGMSDSLNEALLTLDPYVNVTTGGVPIFVRYQTVHQIDGYVEAKKNPEVRRLLQMLGTDVGRKMIDEDVWVKMAEKKIRALLADDQSVVITGMRYKNELAMLLRNSGLSAWVDRPDARPSDETVAHSSENSLTKEDFEHVVDNSSTLTHLYNETERMVRVLDGVVD